MTGIRFNRPIGGFLTVAKAWLNKNGTVISLRRFKSEVQQVSIDGMAE